MQLSQLRTSCHIVLEEGVRELGLPVGIVSHIFGGNYQVFAINVALGSLVEGALFPLASTYCNEVFETGKMVATTEIDGTPGMRLHPLYVQIPLEAYISCPLHHRGAIWGTVNFTSPQIRGPFLKKELRRVQGYAQQIGRWLEELDEDPRASAAVFRARG